MTSYTPELAQWSREFALKELNITRAVGRYMDIYNAKPDSNVVWRKRLKKMLVESRQKSAEAVGLQEQLDRMQQQTDNLKAVSAAKGKKHLRAIRLLLWLNIILTLALVALATYTLL